MSEPTTLEERLFGPGGPYEIADEEVLGATMPVFRNRRHSMREILEDARRYGDDEFLIFGERRISFADHLEAAAATAHALQERYGIEPGDRVAILAANSPEWLFGFWGATCAGAITAALNGWWTGPEIAYGLELVKPKLLIGDQKRLQRLEADPGVPVLEIESGFAPLLEAYGGRPLPEIEFQEDDPALILFTSGTTGFPKGALLSHRCIVGFVQVPGAVRAQQMAPLGLDPDSLPRETMLVTTPMFHVSGVMAIGVFAMDSGAKCVLREGGFDPEDALRLIERERVTSWAALGSAGPRVARDAARHRYDTSSVTRISFGGAPTSPAIQDLLREAFPNAAQAMGTSYGLSEGSALGTVFGGPEYQARPDAVGRASPTIAIEIRDHDGKRAADGEKGEVFIRSPYVMLGYWDDPEATAAAIGPDRWLATGDIGHMEDGLLFIHSRDRDMILRSAENVYPAEIENRLEAHPRVREAAVIGVDHPEHGQEVKAVVVLEEGAALAEAELDRWCREALAAFKVPSVWEFRAELLPRNAAGKVVKAALKGEVEERAAGD